MCIIIIKPVKETVLKQDLKAAYTRNPDGCGIYDVTKHKLIKGLWSFKELWSRVQEAKDHELVIHLRVATSGKIDAQACHPFRLKDGSVLAHNGIISGLSDPHSDRSDTQELVAILDRCRSDSLRLEVLRSHASSNRFAYVTRSSQTHLLGDWHKYRGLSLSNSYGYGIQKLTEYPYQSASKPERYLSMQDYFESEDREEPVKRETDLTLDIFGHSPNCT